MSDSVNIQHLESTLPGMQANRLTVKQNSPFLLERWPSSWAVFIAPVHGGRDDQAEWATGRGRMHQQKDG